MAFSRVACVIASRLDLVCLVSAGRGLRGLILCCLVWPFVFSVLFALAVAVFCSASPLCSVVCSFAFLLVLLFGVPWLALCAGQRFHLCLSFDVACASVRLVMVALSFRCGYWFLLPAVSF